MTLDKGEYFQQTLASSTMLTFTIVTYKINPEVLTVE